MFHRITLGLSVVLALVAGCSDDEAANGTTSSGSGAGSSTGASGTGGGGATGAGSQGGAGAQGASGAAGGSGGTPKLTVAECYADDYVTPFLDGPDYDQFNPTVGSHCMGTNHQDITNIERVVFLGDSVTVGSPPTLSADFYRSKLADALVAKFGLEPPDNFLWKPANYLTGTSITRDSGDFSNCSEWGARTDDLMQDGTQIADCFPQDSLDKRTLVVMTVGGNDINSITQDHIDGVPVADLMVDAQDFVQLHRDAVTWLKEPGRFPNGVFVIFANMHEFTDGTGEVQACDVSALAGFADPLPTPDELKDLVIWANEQYVKTAVDLGVDVIFMLEDFCGHGFLHDDPSAVCYRGPGQEQWLDLTCIHPNPTGHQHTADMFMAVVNE